MGIDGIGRPPGAPIGAIGGVQGSEAPPAAEPFAVNRAVSAAPSSRISAELLGLQRGELSLDQYLDSRVSQATEHLAGKVSPEHLDFVKQSLREQLASDPVLLELVQRTTGGAPASELG